MFLVVQEELESKLELQIEEKRQQVAALQMELSITVSAPEDSEESRKTLLPERPSFRVICALMGRGEKGTHKGIRQSPSAQVQTKNSRWRT